MSNKVIYTNAINGGIKKRTKPSANIKHTSTNCVYPYETVINFEEMNIKYLEAVAYYVLFIGNH